MVAIIVSAKLALKEIHVRSCETNLFLYFISSPPDSECKDIDECRHFLPFLPPSNAHMSSVYSTTYAATKCIDGITTTPSLCHTRDYTHPAPWLALEFPESVSVTRVNIYNRGDGCGDSCATRLRNAEVRLTDQLPTSADQMYTGGELLGTIKGPATLSEIIRVEGAAKIGKYVLIQQNHQAYLNLHEVEAFGKSLLLHQLLFSFLY